MSFCPLLSFLDCVILPYLRGLDFTPPHNEDVPDDVPIVVVAHGLTGGSQIIENHQLHVR